MTASLDRAVAVRLDAEDPLAPYRREFVDTSTAVYLDGNSLGRLPQRTVARLEHVLRDEWGDGLIRSWDRWLDMPRRVGDRLAPVLGARAGEVVVHDSTSVNLYQLVHAAVTLAGDRRVIAVDRYDFPSDRFVVEGVASVRGCTVTHDIERLDEVGVVVRSLVDYRTGAVADLAAETARARAAGAIVVWDLSHAAGVLEVRLHDDGVDFAVGCTYKFLNGGPGAPAFSYVRDDLISSLDQPLRGWFGQRDQFAMDDGWEPHGGIERLLVGTPSILALAAAEEGIALTAAAGIDRIAAKARRLTGYAIDLCDAWGLVTCTPRDAARRGGHVSVVHPDARRLVAALVERHGVVPDYRDHDIVRLGLSPLTTSFVDVYDGLAALASEVRR